VIENQSCRQFLTDFGKFLVRHYPENWLMVGAGFCCVPGRRDYQLSSCRASIIGLLVVLVAVCAWVRWQHVRIARLDSDFRQHLAGVWLRQETDMRCTNTVATDGSFVERSWFSHPDRTNTYQRTGTWLVENGHLIETIRNSTNPAEITPHTGTGQIIHADTDEFVVRWPNSAKTVWQKIIR
jgi:hypothetical protein